MFELPTSVFIDDAEYRIRNRGDFRMVFDCFKALNDSELDLEYRVSTSLIIFYEDLSDIQDIYDVFGKNVQEAVKKMFDFFNCGQPQASGVVTKHSLVNWEQDSQLIAGAVNAVAKKELRAEPYLHWWTFMGYYMNIGDSAFSNIISIRHKIKTGKKLEKYEQEFKRSNPQYFVWDSSSADETQMNNYLRNLWDENGG